MQPSIFDVILSIVYCGAWVVVGVKPKSPPVLVYFFILSIFVYAVVRGFEYFSPHAIFSHAVMISIFTMLLLLTYRPEKELRYYIFLGFVSLALFFLAWFSGMVAGNESAPYQIALNFAVTLFCALLPKLSPFRKALADRSRLTA